MRLPFLLILLAGLLVSEPSFAAEKCAPALDFTVRTLAGEDEVKLCDAYRDQVVLIVNTASKCAFTPQYEGLEALYRNYRERGFVVLGFPSNDFGNQEPGTEKEIQRFCRNTYSIEFPMFEKARVRKGVADPLFQRLAELGGGYPKWNFFKYLIDRNGELVESYSSFTQPESKKLVDTIESLL